MNVVCVDIRLNDMAEEGIKSLNFGLLFSQQPTVDDILDAVDSTPSLFKRDDWKGYRAKLIQGLMTYGVPQLGHLQITNGGGNPVATSMLHARWFLNLEDRERSISGWPYGHITVTRRPIHHNVPVAQETKPKKKGKE